MTQETSEASAHSDEIGKRDFARHPPQAMIRAALARAGVLAIRIIGPPGSGKTELIEATLKQLPGPRRVAAIVVDPASAREADRLQNLCGYVAHVDSAVPDPAAIWRIISQLRLADFDLILIEGCGGMAPLKDIGQDATAAVLAVSGGDDKALEYHALLENASVVLLSKIDVRQLVKFNEHVFRKDVRAIAPEAQIIELSAVTGSGMFAWLQWLDNTGAAKRRREISADPNKTSSNTYLG
jgi:hydrogenase nickel incorporation protein HypB